MWRRQIFGSVFAFWFDVMYLNGHSEPVYNNRTCNIDFFLLEIYVNYQLGSRHIISQLTGPVNAGRVKNVVITYATRAPDLELAKHRQQTLLHSPTATHTETDKNNPYLQDSPLSPWLLIPALRSRAIWANSLSFSSFFSFSFWAIFFSTWALISTASLAYGNNQHFSMEFKYGLQKKSQYFSSYSSQWAMVAYLSIGNVERLSQLGKVFVDVNCLQPPSISGQTFIKRNGVTLWSTWRESK